MAEIIRHCVFYRSVPPIVKVRVGSAIIRSKPKMNVLGVLLDSRLQWSLRENSSIKKAKCTIQLLSKYFKKVELTSFLTAICISILCYSFEMWLIPSSKTPSKQQLLSASAIALKLA
jgi:hypothetical protein